MPAEGDVAAIAAVAGGEVPPLVELAVIRQVHLGHDAQKPPPVNGEGRVVEAAQVTHRSPNEQKRHEIHGAGHDAFDGPFHGLEQGVLLQQVLDRVAGQPSSGNTATAAPRSWHWRATARIRSALVMGSASAVSVVQAATRAKPCW